MKRSQIYRQIAKEHLGIKTLKPANSDSKDFHSLSVSSLEKALEAAYEQGVAAGMALQRNIDRL